MSKVDGVLVGRHPLVARWVLGDRSHNPPQRSLIIPWWNKRFMVLVALTAKPFEPLRQAMPLDLMPKVLFLLAVASARRVSEIHALCIDPPPPFLIQNPRSFHLAPNPRFVPNTSMDVALSSDLEITAFYPEPTSPLEQCLHLMCIFHALHIYLQSTEHTHGPNRSLFIHWDEGRTHHPVVRWWISSCLMEAVCSAYGHHGLWPSFDAAWQPPGLK